MRPVEHLRNLRRAVRRAVAGASPQAILLAGGLGLVVYAYPGLMTIDSYNQLAQGRAHHYTDSHPPVMAALWGELDRIIAGPVTMLVLQIALLVAGLYLVLRRIAPPRRAAWLAVVVLLFPPVLSPMAVIWKDSLMAGALALGGGLLLDARRGAKLAGLLCLWLASAVRYNAPVATLPLIVLLFAWPGIEHAAARYALAAGVWIAITASALAVNAALVDDPMYPWQSSLALMDIAGTLHGVDRTIPDPELKATLAGTQIRVDHDVHAALRAAWNPRSSEGLVTGPTRLWDMPVWGRTPAPASQREAVTRAWWAIVSAHPGAYVRQRLATFAQVIGLSHDHVPGMVVTQRNEIPDLALPEGLSTSRSSLQHVLEHANARLAWHTGLFEPWIYLVLTIVLLAFCRWRDTLALLASGLAMELSLAPLAPASDYRYSHWMVLCACLGLVMTVARRATAPATPASA